jgi:cell division protein FtsI (penicillin-binding protein 3)
VPRLGNPARRLRFATAVILLMFAVLAGRLVQIQASDGAAYAAKAVADRMTAPITLVAPRGAIVDRAGNPLARSVEAVSVDADPKFVVNPAQTAKALAGLLGVTESELMPKLTRKANGDGDPIRFVYLARRMDPEIGLAVKSLKLAGINVRDEQRRDVPDHDMAANMIGFTGWDGGGLAGIEASYDDVLRGSDGSRQYEIGRKGQEIPDGFNKETPAKPGHDVMLTIDRDLQYQALTMLSTRLKAIGASNGSAIVLDAKTGEILAMASYPTFDAAKPSSSTAKNRLDFATGSVIEPGSVHKVVTLGAALQTGVIKPDSTIHIGPTIKKGNVTFRDTHKHGTVDITLQGILAQSSNVGTITIADKLGAQRLYDYQLKFGLGSKTGLGLPGESAGLVQPPNRWSDPSYGSIPIGLGVAVTPLQMTSVYATIANDGVRVTPTLVRGTLDGNGKLIRKPAPRTERVLSAANARALRLDLEAVPTKFGTGKKAAIPNVRVAGKTGTGKRVQDSKYLPGSVSSFIGMVPAEAPRYVVGIFAHGPGESGAKVAAPTFAALADFTLRYYGVAPTGTSPPPIRIYGG